MRHTRITARCEVVAPSPVSSTNVFPATSTAAIDVSYRGTGRRLLYTPSGPGPATVLLHRGGTDHRSLLPLAGRSVCTDPACFTWARYLASACLSAELRTARTLSASQRTRYPDVQARA